MVTMTNATAKIPHRAKHEFRQFAIVFVYLYIVIGAITLFKTAVLHTEGIDYAFWGISAIKAAVLAKFMLLGHAMKIGERNITSPLIWPTLHRGTRLPGAADHPERLEEIVVGLLHHRPALPPLTNFLASACRKRWPAISSRCWCSSPISRSASSVRRWAKAGWYGCSLSRVSREGRWAIVGLSERVFANRGVQRDRHAALA